nr:MAG TPA: hypothetical protein [Bacteriophage sp.]DAZ63161.1 MAG TPA: hypothetical protein [Caudoviricetes sp.]
MNISGGLVGLHMKEIIVFFVIVWVIAYYILKDNYKD